MDESKVPRFMAHGVYKLRKSARLNSLLKAFKIKSKKN